MNSGDRLLYRSLIIIAVILAVIWYGHRAIREGWVTYVRSPYNEMESGTDPIQTYRRDRYRKPYRYPYTFYQSYPYPHMRYGD